jgi:hypothetical protein
MVFMMGFLGVVNVTGFYEDERARSVTQITAVCWRVASARKAASLMSP